MTDERPHAQGPTPWELILEGQRATQRAVEDIRKEMLTAATFNEYQRGTDQRFIAHDRRQAEWEVKSEGAHRELAARIEAVDTKHELRAKGIEDEADRRNDEARKNRGQIWLGIGLAVLAVILPRVWEVLQGTGVQP
jgi:hypothetical protein